MKREVLENFIRNTGYVCSKCGKVFIDGKTHKNQEGICEDCLIAKLEEENRVLKRALELACEAYYDIDCCPYCLFGTGKENLGGEELIQEIAKHFIQKAKESKR